MKIKWFNVNRLPDLTLSKYQSLADTGVEGLLARHSSFLRQWHGICLESSSSLHLLYVYSPAAQPGQRLKVWLGINTRDNMMQLIAPLLKSSPLGSFYDFKETQIESVKFAYGATLTKRERVATIFNPLADININVHYVPQLETNKSARLYDMFRAMEAVAEGQTSNQSLGFRIDLFPFSDIPKVRDSLSPMLSTLRAENSVKVKNSSVDIKSNDIARKMVDLIDTWIDAVETTPCFSCNIYGFASSSLFAKFILNAASSEALERGDVALTPIHQDKDGCLSTYSRLSDKPIAYCQFPDNAALANWPTLYLLEEIEPFFRLPVLFDGEEIEIPKETTHTPYMNGILLGHDDFGRDVMIPINKLPRHSFMCGMPGAGKTNTMLHLVQELRFKHIPFLVLEPAKKEYRSLLLSDEMRDVFLFSPHLRSCFPLRVNPMEFPKGVRLSSHIEALIEVFEGSFYLQDSTRKLLGDAIQSSYTNLGWDIEEINGEHPHRVFPTLSDVNSLLSEAINATDYDKEIKGNMRSFLEVRLGSLLERDTGEVFDTQVSTLAPDEWLTQSAIVELEVLGEQAKNFIVLLLCHYILETLRANPNASIDSNGKLLPIRHALFIEEAHNIIAPTTVQSNPENVNPKVSATAYIVKMLAEVRALREAIFISDQLPTALAVEVTKNTGIKLVHRLSASDDREQVGSAIAASQLQLEQMSTLGTGKAFLFHEDTQKPFRIHIMKWFKQDKGFDETDDKALLESRIGSSATKRSISIALRSFFFRNIDPCFTTLEIIQSAINNINVTTLSNLVVKKRIQEVRIKLNQSKAKVNGFVDIWGDALVAESEVEQLFKKTRNTITELQTMVHLIEQQVTEVL